MIVLCYELQDCVASPSRSSSDHHRAYLREMPAITTAESYTLAHGSPRSPIWEYVTSVAIAAENFECFDTDVCFIGHTHRSEEHTSELQSYCMHECILLLELTNIT